MNIFSLLFAVVASGIALFSMFTAYDANVTSEKLGASQTISSLTSYTNPDDADSLPIVDSAAGQTKRITWGNATSSLGTYFAGVFSPIFSTSAGLAALLSNENGTGNFVLSSSTALTSPRLTSPTITLTSDATGDIYYRNSGGAFTRLGIGASTNYYLRTSASGIPEWDNSVATFPYNASSTFNATTTIAADSRTNRALVLNSIPYQFPSQLSATSGLSLIASSTGLLYWGSPLSPVTGTFSTTTTSKTAYTGSTTIRHNLGVRPRLIEFQYVGLGNDGGANKAGTTGSGKIVFPAKTYTTINYCQEQAATAPVINVYADKAISLHGEAASCGDPTALIYTLTTADETTFTLADSTEANDVVTAHIIWTVYP
jgi:hypothetical protein